MSAERRVTLRILERADKDILKLSRTNKGAVVEFQQKFRRNPDAPGLRLKQLQGDSRLWSARVTDDYRALLLRVADNDYLLVSVKHRRDVYENLDHYSYQINRVTGGIEVVDLSVVGDSIVGRLLSDTPNEPRPAPVPQPEPAGLFSHLSQQQLLDLGVADPLLPLIAKITTDEELLGLAEVAPQLTTDVLFALHDGKTYEEVLDQVTKPVAADEPVDPDDYAAAIVRPATQVTANDAALQAILGESFARWQVFLHPTQRKLVDRHYTGPARIGGGPGTGKTIVALHRTRHLAEQLPAGTDRPILLTTFNRNLAADLRARLLDLAGPELVSRVDIVNIDKLASRVVAESNLAPRRIIDNNKALDEWRAMLLELGEQRWTPEFMAAEWDQVILGQVLTSRTDYFRARRPGRGRPLRREDRDAIWQLTERFTKRLEDAGVWTWRQTAGTAARLELERAHRISANGSGSDNTAHYRYRHIVVDEAQDLSPAHWRMLRAMVAPGPDDMFLVGDTHQRIYDNYVTLSSLGINIRGRSARLTLSYRTTRHILRLALQLLTGETYDDLDGGSDTLAGYRSLLVSEQRPTLRGVPTWNDEKNLIVAQLRAWNANPDGSVAIAVPTREMAAEIIERLTADNILAVEIGPDGPRRHDGIHVGTMHRFKGLEYQRMIIAGATEGLIPRRAIDQYRDADPHRYQRERTRDRSLLFVAATRARDDLAVFWHGTPSSFLPHEPALNP